MMDQIRIGYRTWAEPRKKDHAKGNQDRSTRSAQNLILVF
jgi:hypothetical protein